MQTAADNITTHDSILEYIVNIASDTRSCDELQLGASPRASIDLLKASKAKAFLKERSYVIPDDVKEMVLPVLCHRLILSPEARIERKTVDKVLNRVINKVFIPVI